MKTDHAYANTGNAGDGRAVHNRPDCRGVFRPVYNSVDSAAGNRRPAAGQPIPDNGRPPDNRPGPDNGRPPDNTAGSGNTSDTGGPDALVCAGCGALRPVGDMGDTGEAGGAATEEGGR